MLRRPPAKRVLVARLDNVGDVILSGPAVRAVAAGGDEVVYLTAPRSRAAAASLPGVSQVVTMRAEWIEADPRPVTRTAMERAVDALGAVDADEAVILTSFHQTPLPMALLMRMAGIGRIAAISVDYPGSLLDVRHRVVEDIHEVERALSLVNAAGYDLPPGDDRRLRIDVGHPGRDLPLPHDYVVVHPGASVPARAWPVESCARLVSKLRDAGHDVVLTGGPGETGLTDLISRAGSRPGTCTDIAGRTDFAALAAVIRGATVLVCGNTGPAHIAAAVGTPVVSIFAPTVPAVRWRPWMVPHILLGDQQIACAGCRARICPVPGQPCVSGIDVSSVVSAVERLADERQSVAR